MTNRTPKHVQEFLDEFDENKIADRAIANRHKIHACTEVKTGTEAYTVPSTHQVIFNKEY